MNRRDRAEQVLKDNLGDVGYSLKNRLIGWTHGDKELFVFKVETEEAGSHGICKVYIPIDNKDELVARET